jgi:protein-tyrosine phosphatase
MNDGEMANSGLFDKAAEVINNAVNTNTPILVHCAAGVSRSSTAVIAYLMNYHGVTWTKSLEKLRKERPAINPHPMLQATMVRDLGKKFKL